MNKSLFVEDQAAAKAEDLVKDIKQVALEMKKLRDTVRIFEKQNNTSIIIYFRSRAYKRSSMKPSGKRTRPWRTSGFRI